LRRLCHITQLLVGEELRASPVEIRENVLQLPPLMMYQLSEWWTRKIEEQGVLDHGPHLAATLNAPYQRLYEDVISAFVGGWENARTFIAEIPDRTERVAWASVYSVAQLNWIHVSETARMLLLAVIRGDRVVAEWLADALSKWFSGADMGQPAFAVFLKTDFVTIEHLKLGWDDISSLLGITDEDRRWGGEDVVMLQHAVLIAALRNLWMDVRLVVVELLLQCTSDNAANIDASLAANIAAGFLNGGQWRSGGSLSDGLNTLTPSQYVEAKVRQYASLNQARRDYETRLSGLVARVKESDRPRMISSRAYGFSGADDLDSLLDEQLAIISLLSARSWTPGEGLRRQLDVWKTRQFESINVVREVVARWLQRLGQDVPIAPILVARLLSATSRKHDEIVGRQHATGGIQALKDVVDSVRAETLAAQEIDPERLLQLARYASSKAFSLITGKFPLQQFSAIGETDGPLEDFSLVREQVPKGELTALAIDQRPGNEEQFWAQTLSYQVGALVLGDILRTVETRDAFGPDSNSYWMVLKAEFARITAAHRHPILILDSGARPEWVWQWQHLDYHREYIRPEGLEVRRTAGHGDGYLCNFNEAEVYVAPIPTGCSIILERETLLAINFRRFANGTFVDVTCAGRSDTRLLVDLKLQLSRAVQLGGGVAVRLRYATDANTTTGVQD
jgi:hypothetical protein